VFVFGNKLGLPIHLQIKASYIFNDIIQRGLCNGKDPKGFAAAVLYLVVKEEKINKTQKEVAEAAKVTEVTIRSRVKDIKCSLDYL
jgi:transcription initiation factor TFIIB